MCSDIANAASLARLTGIGSPTGIVAALQLDALREPSLGIFHIDTPQPAKLTLRDASLHLLDGRIGGLGMRQGQRETCLFHLLLQLQGLLEGEGHRLVQHDVEAHVKS